MKKMTCLLNLALLVVCTQFVFADDSGKQYVSFEDVQSALADKDSYDEGAYRKSNPSHGGGGGGGSGAGVSFGGQPAKRKAILAKNISKYNFFIISPHLSCKFE